MTAQGTGDNEKEVLLQRAFEELDSEIRLLNDSLGRYRKASVEKKMASEALKIEKLIDEYNSFASKIPGLPVIDLGTDKAIETN